MPELRRALPLPPPPTIVSELVDRGPEPLALDLRVPPLESHPPVSSEAPPISIPSCDDGAPILGEGSVVPPTASALRSALSSVESVQPPGHVSELLRRAHERPSVGLDLRLCLRQVLASKDYSEETINSLLAKYDRSIKRYQSAFSLFVRLALEMEFQFPDLSVASVVSVISTLHLVSPSQARNAYASLLMFPPLLSLKLDPVIRQLRREWNSSVPQYACFWSGKSLLTRLADTPVQWHSRSSVRDRLIIVWRLLHLYRSFDLSNLLRLWSHAPDHNALFIAAKRKGWDKYRWERIMFLPDRPRICPATLLFRYISITKDTVLHLPSPAPVLVGLVKPHRPLSASRIASLTKVIMARHGVDTTVFKAHSTRGAGLEAQKDLGLPSEVSCEVGSWKNSEAFDKHYKRLGAVQQVAVAVSASLDVHSSPEPSCAPTEPSTTPLNEHAKGRGEGEGEAQDGSGPTRPKPKPKVALVRGWRASPRLNTLPKRPREADGIPTRNVRTRTGRVGTSFLLESEEFQSCSSPKP
mmetsp:Transcript_17847/g.28286  ORF Transcript_17847/g.28286 Transcript_17847/m.28286 type:complete len:526 (-) Transcript_17847:59-1636(-)